jgi:sialate O-acetylesterase
MKNTSKFFTASGELMSIRLIIICLVFSLILSNCSKKEINIKTPPADPFASTTGLNLINAGDYGIFQFLTDSGSIAETANNSVAVGGTSDVAVYAGTSFQKWRITRLADGTCNIMNLGSGLYAQSYNYNGQQVLIQNSGNNTDAQHWDIATVSGKAYKAINKADGLAITGSGGAMIQLKPYTGLASQLWGYNALPANDTVKATVFNVNNILQSNMVIQRDKPFTIWGHATPNFTVSVRASYNTSLFTTTADVSGVWRLTIPATPVNTSPQTIIASVDGKTPVVFSNILIGDVWLCSGQSNMVMPLDSVQPFYGFEGVVNYKAEIAAANYPQIRAITATTDFETNPSDTLKYREQWMVCSPQTAGQFSAVSYYFARKLNTTLNVPIGLVISAASGTSCEAWVSKATIQVNPLLSAYYVNNSPNQLYNGMIYPLRYLSIKGFLWYQGENNRHDDPQSNYGVLSDALINNWRILFSQGQLPFYLVQMTPFAENFFNTVPWGDVPTADDYARFREIQAGIRTNVPHTGMAITLDVGQEIFIHPQNKKPVGERLALLALKNDYGQQLQSLGPQYLSNTINNNTVLINFVPGTAEGLNTIGNAPIAQYFFVAGTDHVFRLGTATIVNGNQISITAPAGTPLPIQAIRYAFTNFPFTNLQNSAGLPMEAFRTDNWSH